MPAPTHWKEDLDAEWLRDSASSCNVTRPVQLVRVEDSEGDHNRGWRIDRVEALFDGALVGYLNISYIPMDRYKAHYPQGVLSYADLIAGHCLFEYPDDRMAIKDHDIANFDDAKLRRLVRRLAWLLLHKDFSMSQEDERMDRSELMAEVKLARQAASKRFKAGFAQFQGHFLDKPVVGFIRTQPSVQRQGIATALYVEGAKWMAEKGLRLHASGIQQPEARGAWAKMQEQGWTAQDGKRTFLDLAGIVSRPMVRQDLAVA